MKFVKWIVVFGVRFIFCHFITCAFDIIVFWSECRLEQVRIDVERSQIGCKLFKWNISLLSCLIDLCFNSWNILERVEFLVVWLSRCHCVLIPKKLESCSDDTRLMRFKLFLSHWFMRCLVFSSWIYLFGVSSAISSQAHSKSMWCVFEWLLFLESRSNMFRSVCCFK